VNFQETGCTAIGIHWYKEFDNSSRTLFKVHSYLVDRLCDLPLSLVKWEALTMTPLLGSVSTPFLTLLLVRKSFINHHARTRICVSTALSQQFRLNGGALRELCSSQVK